MNLDLSVLKRRDKQVLVLEALAGLIALLLYLNFLFKPAVLGLKEVNPRLAALKRDIKTVEAWVKKQDEVESRLAGLRSKAGYYEGMLSGEEEVPTILEELSGIARGANVQIIIIQPRKITTAEAGGKKIMYREIPIYIKAKCGYHQLGHFIGELENSRRLLVIREIGVESSVQTPRSHDVDLTVSAFLFPEAK